MAKLTIGQKAERVLQLLLGLRKPRVAAALMAHGFTNAELQEGWELLRRVTRTRLDVVSGAAPLADPSLLVQIDGWENKWFPIASATLKRRAPKVHAWMFNNLSQTEGIAVLISVGTFLERWDKLAASREEGGPGEGGVEAREILELRGMTQDVIDEARGLLQRAGSVELEEGNPPEEDFAEAEAALWTWYLEWSTIALTAIKDRKLLRELGFLRRRSSPADAPDGDGAGNATQPAAGAGA